MKRVLVACLLFIMFWYKACVFAIMIPGLILALLIMLGGKEDYFYNYLSMMLGFILWSSDDTNEQCNPDLDIWPSSNTNE